MLEAEVKPGPLRILGIDPGLADVGYGVIDAPLGSNPSQLVEYGVFKTPAHQPLVQRLLSLEEAFRELVDRFNPSVIAVEELFFAKNIRTIMAVAHGRAACILGAASQGASLIEYTPVEIKQALTGHGGAGKLQVQKMVRVLLGLPEIPKPDHAADALAAALSYVHSKTLVAKIKGMREMLPMTDNPAKRLLEQAGIYKHRRRS